MSDADVITATDPPVPPPIVYTLVGVVTPQRAPLSLKKFAGRAKHLASGRLVTISASILFNQIHVSVETAELWDVKDLRNMVLTFLRTNVAMVGFLTGLAYDIDVVRVVCAADNVDYVYGIEMPCLFERRSDEAFEKNLSALRKKCGGDLSVYLTRCLGDLVSAMRHSNDTHFYCYRAIESLMAHNAAKHGIDAKNQKETAWAHFREVARVTRETIMEIKGRADPLRHGGFGAGSADTIVSSLTSTWDIVKQYLDQLPEGELIFAPSVASAS